MTKHSMSGAERRGSLALEIRPPDQCSLTELLCSSLPHPLGSGLSSSLCPLTSKWRIMSNPFTHRKSETLGQRWTGPRYNLYLPWLEQLFSTCLHPLQDAQLVLENCWLSKSRLWQGPPTVPSPTHQKVVSLESPLGPKGPADFDWPVLQVGWDEGHYRKLKRQY